jgi:hypothetical protein
MVFTEKWQVPEPEILSLMSTQQEKDYNAMMLCFAKVEFAQDLDRCIKLKQKYVAKYNVALFQSL